MNAEQEKRLTFLEEQIKELPADEYRLHALNHYAARILPPTGNVLDFGAGAGHLVNILEKKNKNIHIDALDISHELLEFMKERFKNQDNIRVINGEQDSLPQGHYDRIYTLDVLEHIEDDIATMKELRNSLKENGKMLINVPAHQELFSDFDEKLGHFRRYSKQELRKKLEEVGFTVEHIQYWNTLGYLIVKLTTSFSGLPRPGTVRVRTTAKEEVLNTTLRWWFHAIENTIPSPKGLSLIAIVSK